MRRRLRIPIRLRLMLTMLVLVTIVLGSITFATVSLFEEDKQAYVNDLTSMVAQSLADEGAATLSGYRERLAFYARSVIELSAEDQRAESEILFEEFAELIALSVERRDGTGASAFNTVTLERVGLTRDDVADLLGDAFPADELERGQSHVRNASTTTELLCFSLAFAQPLADGDTARVSALIRSDRLQQLSSRFSAYELFLTDSTGAALVHVDPERLLGREPLALDHRVESSLGGQSASLTLEFDSAGRRMIGSYAHLGVGGILAGAHIPRSAAHLGARRLIDRLLLLAGILLVSAVVVGILWSHRITQPMEHLTRATRTLAGGNFDIRLDIDSPDEIGDLAESFGKMATDLKQREEDLHEAHGQLVQSEKMAAFGQLGAGIAHEVKNPLAGILGCAQLAVDDTQPGSQLREDLELIAKETLRCKEIIDNLLKFARQDQTVLQPVQVNNVLEDAFSIVHHQLRIHSVKVSRELDPDLPLIQGNANQLQQVFINLLINAQQAMEEDPGEIVLSTRLREDGRVEVCCTDNGPGIPREIQAKLFEPFFTTKPTGKGTGLGLSVSFGIIKDHGGEIEVDSEVGRGTSFVVIFPSAEIDPALLDAATREAEGLAHV